MKKKVSLTEIVAAKILFAILLALIYWMWARSSYNEQASHIGQAVSAIAIFLLVVHEWRVYLYRKECTDEMAEQNLRRCDSICFRILIILTVIIALAGGTLAHIYAGSAYMMGWAMIISLIFLAVLRTILFLIMDKRGI